MWVGGGQGLPGATHLNNMQLIKHTLWNMELGQSGRLQAADGGATSGKWNILTDELKSDESNWMFFPVFSVILMEESRGSLFPCLSKTRQV